MCSFAGRISFSSFANNLESHVLRVGPAYCSRGWRLAERQIGDMQGTSDGVRAVRSALGRQNDPLAAEALMLECLIEILV